MECRYEKIRIGPDRTVWDQSGPPDISKENYIVQ